MMRVDVVIDPLAVCGQSWFLGRIFHCAEPGSAPGGIGLLRGVVLLTRSVTGWIGERTLPWAGILVHVAVFLVAYALKTNSGTRGWTAERPAGERVAVITTTIDERGH